MKKYEEQFKEYLENDYDLNEHIHFFAESHEFNIEIKTGDVNADLKIIGTATTGSEEGGEPDEFLYFVRDKYLYLKEITLYGDEIEIDTTETFRKKIEEILNTQMYDD